MILLDRIILQNHSAVQIESAEYSQQTDSAEYSQQNDSAKNILQTDSVKQNHSAD